MNDAELKGYETWPMHYWQSNPDFSNPRGDNGYDAIGSARKAGWKARASWGRNGWDLGSWPLVVFFFRENGGPGKVVYELAQYVEGDLTVWTFPTDELRSEAVDRMAFWWWRNEGESWVSGLDIDDIPDHLRGPFSWARCEAEREKSA